MSIMSHLSSLIFLGFFCTRTTVINGSVLSSILQPSYCFIAPKMCPNRNITFYLYTSSNPNASLPLSVTDPNSIIDAPFESGPIKILIHGYTSGKDETPNKEIRPAYLERPSSINVISMDYSPLVQSGCYFHAVPNTGVTANCTAQFIQHLLRLRPDIRLSQIHLIGHSLGAQVAGQVSNFLRVGRIERITSLDAALPLYLHALTPSFKEINKGDAKFIDAVHTNSGLAGQSLPYADVDFYANNGVFQPGCGFLDLDLSCDHARSAAYFAESINSEIGFIAHRCACPPPYTWGRCTEKAGPTEMFGEYVNPRAIGIYAFKTANKSPYALLVEQQQRRSSKRRRLAEHWKNRKNSLTRSNVRKIKRSRAR